MMTTLHIVLALVAAVLIGGIVIYNLVQERRFRKEAERMFSQRREDIMLGESVLVDGKAQEAETAPRLFQSLDEKSDKVDAPPETAEATSSATGPVRPARAAEKTATRESRRTEVPGSGPLPRSDEDADVRPSAQANPAPKSAAPASRPDTGLVAGLEDLALESPPPREIRVTPVAPAFVGDDEAEPAPVAPAAVLNLDAETEFVARIQFAAPAAADFAELLAALRRIGKPVRALGHRADGGVEPLLSQPRASYARIEVGLQLADRNGAVSHEDLDVFCRALYAFAADAGGAVICPDKQDALQTAKALDMLCVDVDVLIGLNVVASDARPFTSEAIHTLAAESGLIVQSDGSYHARDLFGHTLFTLTNQEETPFPANGRGLTTHGITLLFDVPRVADGLTVFDRMARLGFDLAWRLEGKLVDDNGRPISEDGMARERKRLAGFYGRMESRGIPAGGERALRLFV